MCNFLSGIVFDDGRFLSDPLIDSHTLLQKRYNIRSEYEGRKYCLVEITGDNANLESYHLDWRQERKPEWWDENWDESIEIRAKQIISPFIIDGNLVRGPVENNDGDKEWYQNGLLHRLDGPAVEWSDGYKAWYIEGTRYTEQEFNEKIKPSCDGRIVEIDGKKYKLVSQQIPEV